MTSFEYTQRQTLWDEDFSFNTRNAIQHEGIEVRFYPFESTYHSKSPNLYDSIIQENITFYYPVFLPKNQKKNDSAIILLHGLNERKWNKYLTWAETLCRNTGKPIILFPIAFHMNRAPEAWSNPHEMQSILYIRRERNGRDKFLSFVNVALSERISEQPFRFYNSGRQSLKDLEDLAKSIKEGRHPLFKEDVKIDLFAYSIGAFLSQILLMTNTENLFSNSKLFMFCGGSIFNHMFGKSKCILDEQAFDNLLNYYMNEFCEEVEKKEQPDKALKCFESMIAPEWNKTERESFFKSLGKRLSGISLLKDKVIPYTGIKKALGDTCTDSHIHLMDFDYDYSHEIPFPILGKVNGSLVNSCFNQVFSEASAYLA